MTDFSETRVWFITGSSSGLGLSLVKAVLSSGERVFATLRTPSSLSSLQAAHPDQLQTFAVDVTNHEQVIGAFERLEKTWGRVDVVVNNAGYGLMAEVESTPEEEARKQVEVLFWGAVDVTRQALRFFREVNPPNLSPRILQISSAGGFQGSIAIPFYSAGKFALEGFSESLSKEVDSSVRITIVEPGGFRTSWAGSGMIELPAHPAYASPDSLCAKVRHLRRNMVFPGDPHKAALAMIKVSKSDNPPLRLPLGKDSLEAIRAKLRAVEKELQEWEEVAVDTAFEDSEGHLERLQQHGIISKSG